jgi:hypothetical protein
VIVVSGSGPKYWFPAKRYGWGWGPPVTWQGWAVLVVWLLAFVGGVRYFAYRHGGPHVAFACAMVAFDARLARRMPDKALFSRTV